MLESHNGYAEVIEAMQDALHAAKEQGATQEELDKISEAISVYVENVIAKQNKIK